MMPEIGTTRSVDDVSPITSTRMFFRNKSVSPLGGIRDCGFIKNGRGIPGEPRILGSYALVYLAHGSGWYRDAQHDEPLRPGDMVLVLPDVAHWYGPQPGQAFDTLHVIFDGPAFDVWRSSGLFDELFPITHFEPVTYWLERMQLALGSGTDGIGPGGVDESLRLQNFLSSLAGARMLGDAETTWSERAKTRIAADRDVRVVASSMGLSYDAFRKKFTRIVGVSPNRFVTTLLIDQACQLLATEDATLRDIAERLRFTDEFHLSRRFKAVVGVSPSEFRARYR
jgi:AraC-like DNA-binding protein